MKKKQNQSLQDKLKAYSALGAAMMAMSPTADATVQCTDINLSFAGGDPNFLLDIDGDGNTDFRFSFRGAGSVAINTPSQYGTNNQLIGSSYYPFPLPYGATISAGQSFASTTTWLSVCSGYFCGVTNAYVGVQFTIGGNTHFGWVEISVPDNMNYTIHSACYDDTPATAVNAGVLPAAAIPTMSEWSLITLVLMLLSFGTVFVTRREEVLAIQGQEGGTSGFRFVLQKPPFIKSLYLKALVATACLATLAGGLSFAVYGTIALVDVVGTLIAGPIFAYLMHLLAMSESGFRREE